MSRSVVAIAALGVASAAFAAPASAAVPAGVTRDQVASTIASVRADYNADGSEGLSQASYDRLNILANQVCGIATDSDELTNTFAAQPTNVDFADGIIVSAEVIRGEDEDFTLDNCTFAALVTGAASSLTGSYTLTVTDEFEDPEKVTVWNGPTSGNVFVTPATFTTQDDDFLTTRAVLTASGNATRPITVPTSTRVLTPKTAQQVKAAQKAYDKSAASAKKAYKKALKKAGKSTSKKKAAKKKYKARIAKATAAYGVAAGTTSKIVTGSRNDTERLPYNLGAQIVASES